MKLLSTLVLMLGAAACGATAADPWQPAQMIQPAELKQLIDSGKPPVILMVGPRILYNGAHIKGASFAGPAGSPEGLDRFHQALAKIPVTADLVIYCGCCPMERCPNIRPAFQLLKEMKYTHVRVLQVPTNLPTDWTAKGYPVEKGDIAK